MALSPERYLRDRASFYRGTVKVYLQQLDFEDPGTLGVRTVDQKNVDELIRKFSLEGDMRLEPEHYIPVLISEETLREALQLSGIGLLDTTRYAMPRELRLPEHTRLKVLHGQHRLSAAKETPWDPWWIVDLYNDDMPQEIVARMREEQSNAQPFSDGDVFRNYRFHQYRNNSEEAKKWLARLTENKRKRVRQLIEKEMALCHAFDNLLPFSGLWLALRLGCLNRLLPLRCREEICCYLNRIYSQWSNILGDHQVFLDVRTVILLQLLTPKHSTHDAAKIRSMMEKREIFPTVNAREARDDILANVLSCDGRIITIETLFSDIIYFEDCRSILRILFPSGFKESMRRAFYRAFTGMRQHNGMVKIQIAEDNFIQIQGTEELQRELGYKQLFLAAMRAWPLSRKAKHSPLENLDREHWYRLAKLALDLGFAVEKALEIERENEDPDVEMTLELLYRFRPPELYTIDESRLVRLARHMAEEIHHSTTKRERHRQPKFTTDSTMQPLARRSNAPSDESFREEQDLLYADVMFNYHPPPLAHLTSLGIRRDIFVSFFGETALPNSRPHSQNSRPDSEYHTADDVNDHASIIYSPSFYPLSGRRADNETISNTSERNIESSEAELMVNSIDPDSVEELFEGNPYARGFDRDSRDINTFHSLEPGQKPSAAITEFLADRVLVLYVWDKRQYAKFPDVPEQKKVFEQMICSLANEKYGFFVAENDRLVAYKIKDLWDRAGRTRLIMAAPKIDLNLESNHGMRKEIWKDILSYIDNI